MKPRSALPTLSMSVRRTYLGPFRSRKEQIKHDLVTTNIKSVLAGMTLLVLFLVVFGAPVLRDRYEHSVAYEVSLVIDAARQEERSAAIPRLIADTKMVTEVCRSWWFGAANSQMPITRHNPTLSANKVKK